MLPALKLHPEFQDPYATARQLQTELMAEEILEIAPDESIRMNLTSLASMKRQVVCISTGRKSRYAAASS